MLVNCRTELREVQVVYDGAIYRARTAGSSIVAFGESSSAVKQRLKKLEEMRSTCAMKECDRKAERAEWAAERYAAKAARRAVRFAPRG
jgi:hypothetical protein